MSAIIPSAKLDRCAICLEAEFTPSNPALTHVGGEDHDGFHKSCLAEWLIHNPICPLDRRAIDRSSLGPRTDIIRSRFKTAMRNAVLAADFGATLFALGGVWAAGADRVATCELIAKMPILEARVASIAAHAAMTFAAMKVSDFLFDAVEEGLVVRCTTVALGAIAIASRVAVTTEGEALGGVTGAAVTAGIGFLAGSVSGFDVENIGFGTCVGGLASIMVGLFNREYALKMSIVGLPLLAGTTAGILTLMRR